MASTGLLRPHQSRISLLQRVLDAGLILGTLYIATLLPRVDLAQEAVRDAYTMVGLLGVVTFTFVAEMSRLYASWRGSTISAEILRAIWCWALATLTLLVIGFATKTSVGYSRVAIALWCTATPVGLSLVRIAVRQALRAARDRGYNKRIGAIVGSGPLAQQISKTLLDNASFGIENRGFFDDEGEQLTGSLDELIELCAQGKVDVVYMALPLERSRQIRELTGRLQNSTASIYLVPDLLVFDLMQARVQHLGDVPVISILESPFLGIDGSVKRLEDVILGSLILLLISIPMLFIALAVKLTSSGPIFFKQRRYGLNGKEISVWKFRSMSVLEDGDQVKQATKGDVRITPLGAFLRKTSLDELPQFINVIQGQMSIVGPRPHAVAHNEQYRQIIGDYMLRHKVKPGITGWAQINGWRGETDTLEKMEKRVEFDLYYIRNWSLYLDLKIVFLTVFRGFNDSNAY
jgi:putative colanic acid biosynthesis UDP-glucose lipid carrier transferase